MKSDIRMVSKMVSDDGERLMSISRIFYFDDGEVITECDVVLDDLDELGAFELADEIYKATLKPVLFVGIDGEYL